MDQFTIDYSEGAAVGYKWVDKNNLQPLFPFGHGLSYTSFAYGPIRAAATPSGGLRAHFTLRNTGRRAGMAVGQVYASPAGGGWEAPRRLVGFAKLALAPGQVKAVDVDIDPRLLANFDSAAQAWRVAPGAYTLTLGASSRDLRGSTSVNVPALTLALELAPWTASVRPSAAARRARLISASPSRASSSRDGRRCAVEDRRGDARIKCEVIAPLRGYRLRTSVGRHEHAVDRIDAERCVARVEAGLELRLLRIEAVLHV